MYTASVLKSMLGQTIKGVVIPVELLPTDRILQRWDVSVSGGPPRDSERLRSRPPPLDEDAAYVVDQILLKTPRRTKKLIDLWYRTHTTTAKIGRRMNIRREGVEAELVFSLCLIRTRFVDSKHVTLLQLLRISI